MYIKRAPVVKPFTQIDKRVIENKKLSDGAKVLYMYLSGLHLSTDFTDGYLMKVLGLSRRAIANRKKELKDCDLIYIEQLGPRIFMMYIGNTKNPASEVKKWWDEEKKKDLPRERVAA